MGENVITKGKHNEVFGVSKLSCVLIVTLAVELYTHVKIHISAHQEKVIFTV